jgi:hypothetical protein
LINISNPSNPTDTGGYDTPGDVKGIDVMGSLIFVADGADGLVILRNTDLKVTSHITITADNPDP